MRRVKDFVWISERNYRVNRQEFLSFGLILIILFKFNSHPFV